ncbi:hypothetical protein F3Y22_tig00111621pilonHSYRG00105 [Hibiscus syriacus]|uniref:Uncharacterized protein n=1 Tax=Hibiscus syriacus TaxID=106335 RepID=A0A6A2YJ86_HIBSY|nr:hypothetical protein F3Y22_tig00111621pilonHSYRG00105 [Hibiscus syriacus]
MVVTHHRARRGRMLSWQQNLWSLLLVASWQRRQLEHRCGYNRGDDVALGASAFFVTQNLRGLSRDGRTVTASVHQPSSEFFARARFPCPALRNPSDHFLRCINSDFDRVKATLKGSMKLRVCIHFITPWITGLVARRRMQQKNATLNTMVAPDRLSQSPSLRTYVANRANGTARR